LWCSLKTSDISAG